MKWRDEDRALPGFPQPLSLWEAHCPHLPWLTESEQAEKSTNDFLIGLARNTPRGMGINGCFGYHFPSGSLDHGPEPNPLNSLNLVIVVPTWIERLWMGSLFQPYQQLSEMSVQTGIDLFAPSFSFPCYQSFDLLSQAKHTDSKYHHSKIPKRMLKILNQPLSLRFSKSLPYFVY